MTTEVSSNASLTTRARFSLKSLSAVTWVILIGAAAKFVLHTVTGAQYGFFVDEFYTIALSKHLALGYVDVPPLVPLICAASRWLLGESITAMHLLPALAGAFTLVFACLITKEMGGKTAAAALTALGFLAASPWLIQNSYFSYDAFDQLVVAAFIYLLVRYLKSGDRRLWIWLGVLAGVACITKMTLLYLGPGFLAALLVSSRRRDLLTRWPWIGAALCLLIVSPYLLWQVDNGWPTVRYWMNYGTQRLYRAPVGEFLLSYVWDMNPVLAVLYLPGLWRIFRRFEEHRYSFLGVMFLSSLALFVILRARLWMLSALFLPLIAAGAIWIEEITAGKRWGRVLQGSAAFVLLAGGVLFAPVDLPLIPLDQLPDFAGKYPLMQSETKVFSFGSGDYPINLGLRIGWEDLVQKVAAVYNSLPAEERAKAGIFTNWYGPASAIDYYAQKYGLPHAVSGHLTYYLWGPGSSWDVMIVLTNYSVPLEIFSSCEMKGRIYNKFTIPVNQLTMFVCRKPHLKIEEMWKHMEMYQ